MFANKTLVEQLCGHASISPIHDGNIGRCFREGVLQTALPLIYVLFVLASIYYARSTHKQRHAAAGYEQLPGSLDSHGLQDVPIVPEDLPAIELPASERLLNIAKWAGAALQVGVMASWLHYRSSLDDRAAFYYARPAVNVIVWAALVVSTTHHAFRKHLHSRAWIHDIFFVLACVIALTELYSVFVIGGSGHDSARDREFILASSALTFALSVLSILSPYHPAYLYLPSAANTKYRHTTEYRASWYSTFTFSWVSDILSLGFKRRLEEEDLWQLGPDDQAINAWKRYRAIRSDKHTLFWNLVFTFKRELSLQAFYSVITPSLKYLSPYFLQRLLQYLQDPTGVSKLQAWFYVFGLFVAGAGVSLLEQQSFFIGRHIGLRLRGLLVTELAVKTLRRARGASVDDTSDNAEEAGGEEENGDNDDLSTDGKVMNLASVDVQRITETSAYLDGVYLMPISILTGIVYLYLLLGPSALVGVTVMVVTYPVSQRLFQISSTFQDKINAISDKRIATVNEAFNGIRILKLFGWESRFIEKINVVREEQLGALTGLLYSWMLIFVCTNVLPMAIMISTLATYTLILGNALTADVAFTFVAVLNLVRSAFDHFPGYMQWMISGLSGIRRIQKYLGQEEIEPLESRLLPGSITSMSAEEELASVDVDAFVAGLRPVSSRVASSAGTVVPGAAGADDDDIAIGFYNASFAWDTPESSTATEQSTKVAGSPSFSVSTASTSAATSTSGSPVTSGASTPLLSSAESRASTDFDAVNSALVKSSKSKSKSQKAKQRNFRLRNLNIQFPRGKLSIIAGPTGHGKTSLLLALLGEMKHTAGHIKMPASSPKASLTSDLVGATRITDVAYVAQEAWLRGCTIRENILFGEKYDPVRYREVVRMCALETDFKILKAADMTEVGEKGITLSGGQKQRVALARAVYSHASHLLLDDCLSAVDSHTAKHILLECLASRSPIIAGRTIVLVTHHVSLCVHVAQYVVALKNGRVAGSGAPLDVVNKGLLGDPAEILNMSAATAAAAADKDAAEDAATTADASETPAVSASPSDDAANAEEGRLIEDEERESGSVKLSVLLAYFKAAGPWYAWAFVLSMFLIAQAVLTLQDYWIRVWVSSVDDPDTVGRHSVMFYLGIYAGIGLLFVAIKLLQLVCSFAMQIRASRSIHEDLLERTIRAKPRFYDITPIGRVINRFSRDMQTLDEAVCDQFNWTLYELVFTLGVMVVIAYVTPAFLFAAVFIIGAYVLIGMYYIAASRELKRLESVANSPILSLFSELVRGSTTIRAFGAQDSLIAESVDNVNAYNRPFYLVWAANRWLSVRIDVFGAFVAFFAGVFILLKADSLDAGLAGFSLSYALAFSQHVLWVVRGYSLNEMNFTSVERLLQYMDIEQEAPAVIADNRPPASWPHAGAIEAKDLVIEYKPGVPVVHGISFKINSRERIGVVGRTGAGKSTLSLGLLRFVEAAAGSIEIDGVDISKIGLDDLRRNITVVPQDPVLFNGTVRSNLDPFDEHDDSVLWEALRRSHLIRDPSEPVQNPVARTDTSASATAGGEAGGAQEETDVFQDLESPIKENGGNLSLGQRQLVSIARAMVRRSRVVILDEASASVDFETDSLIQQTIRTEIAANSTVLTIAHRLKTIADYDRIIVMDKGRIVEFDKPATLLATEGSIFRDMCQASGEFELLVQIANGTAKL